MVEASTAGPSPALAAFQLLCTVCRDAKAPPIPNASSSVCTPRQCPQVIAAQQRGDVVSPILIDQFKQIEQSINNAEVRTEPRSATLHAITCRHLSDNGWHVFPTAGAGYQLLRCPSLPARAAKESPFAGTCQPASTVPLPRQEGLFAKHSQDAGVDRQLGSRLALPTQMCPISLQGRVWPECPWAVTRM